MPGFMRMYHGWTYDTNGDLDFVTQSEGYPDFEFDKVNTVWAGLPDGDPIKGSSSPICP